MTTDHMPLVSHQSRLSANKDDNEMIPEAWYRSLGIYVIAEENPGKPQIGALDQDFAISHHIIGGPLSQNKVGRIAQHVRKERR